MKSLIQWILDLLYPIFKKFLPYQVYAYLGVGAINTVLNIAIFVICYQFLIPNSGFSINNFIIASYTISLLIAFITTVPTGFWLAKHFAFNQNQEKQEKGTKQLFKYFLVVLQGLGSDYLILKALIVFLNFQPPVAKVISTVVVLTFNYVLQKYFTFKVNKTIV